MPGAMGAETPGAIAELPSEVTVRQDVYVRRSSGLVRTVGPTSALFANLVAMGIIVNFFWIVFASYGYPNANLVTTVGIGVLINVGVGFVYWMLSSAMPRSGGDYVFMGRIFHPSIGLATNLVFSVVFITWAGLFAWYVTDYCIPMVFASYSIAGGGSQALSWSKALTSSTTDIFVVSAIILLLVILISLLPTKWVFRTTVGIFVVTAVIYVIMIGLMVATSQSTFASHWNAANPGNTYASVAASGASTDAITTSGTFLGIVYTMLSFIGYANSSYYAGEIRGNPTRTQGLAIFGAPLIFAALIAGLYAMTYMTFGRDFIVGVSSGYLSGTIPLAAIPSPLFLAAYIVPSGSFAPWLAAFLSFGTVLTFFGFSLIYFIIPTRNLFAWSFDRVTPSFLARVSRRGVPWVAVLALGIFAFVSLWYATYTTIFNYLSYSNFGFWFAVGIVCLGGALFPFLRPKLFAQAPRIVRTRVGPVPILTLVGAASFGAAWFVSYASSTAQFLGVTQYSYGALLFLPIVFVVGFVLYWISYAIQKHRGIPVDLISKELPPD
ncbi:MAG: amino acid permease [Thermoplasmata archaeon]|jgi:basic amino acid/polyamine antiporter, APA family